MKTQPPTLLIVEDDEKVREVFSMRLKVAGYNIMMAEDGKQALGMIDENHLDLVLLDIEMPGMTGLDVLKIVRQQYSAAALPIIMVSGSHSSDAIVKALNLGANDFVPKPIDFPVALARIRTQLSRKRAEEALRESEERYALAVLGANDGLWDWNLKTNEFYSSPRWKSMLGYEEHEIGNNPEAWFSRIHPEEVEQVRANVSLHLNSLSSHFESEHRLMHKDGSYRWMLSRGLAVRDRSGKVSRMAGSLTDITENKVADALTGLPNRVLFMDQLGRALERAKYIRNYQFAVFFLDLDRFKLVNDSLGHLIGDQLLIAAAKRLKSCLHSGDIVARLGGDEFAILMQETKYVSDATSVAERIQKALSQPFNLIGQEVFSSASIGIALSESGYERPEDLLRDADTAMYRAKALGKARCEMFDTEMRDRAVARLQLETDLRRALERREFQVYYQAITSLATGQISGFEALVRWQHPTRGLISPEEFIPIAEETGLIVPIDQWVLLQACNQMKQWQELYGNRSLTICVNFSSKQFMQPDLVGQIRQVLEETGLEPNTLNLELTEHLIMENAESSIALLQQLRGLDVRVGIDDFGTGYSSLSYLYRFPIDTLKIDRSFISQMGAGEENSVIVRTIINLAHNLGAEVVAEGVETEEQLQLLKRLHCEHAQGFYFSDPVNAETAEQLIQQGVQREAHGVHDTMDAHWRYVCYPPNC
jgi:diguanylate cyclase (GGDEF)-like protein/PAS domain S-box-containing protein